MEKYYIVTEESELKKDFLEYQENAKVINEHVKKFMVEQGISTTQYIPHNTSLYIQPNWEDEKKFDKVLGQPQSAIRPFKKNSKINKAWINSLKDNDLKVIEKPYVGLYFNDIWGSHWSSIFEINQIVYCSFRYKYDFETPKGFKEMKASEFYKIIEDKNS